MKKYFTILFLSAAVSGVSIAVAAAQTQASKDAVLQNWNTYTAPVSPWADSDLYKENQFELGLETSYVQYKEPSVSVKEWGPFLGAYGQYDWRPLEARDWFVNVFHIDGHLNNGLIDYKSPDGKATGIYDIMAEPRLWIGRDFTPFQYTRFTPYVGLGYRFLYDNFGSVSGGYDRFANYLYAPIGLEVMTDTMTGWQLGWDVEFDIFIHGWMHTQLSDLNSGFPDITNTQDRGYGIRGSFSIIRKMARMNLVITPYVRYWNIHQSDTKTFVNNITQIPYFGYEPSNNSTEVGIKFGVQF